ncbi:gliding motility-associated C-terminal domain-containing protein [Lacinutrix neustonica]|uniref:Gliding motility-associated C-terminal domain-containing protein n=1 Tax=Lacinutrix neustonica TaxID=2980107 RepID=A0A9E8MW94_9FLAO|nr:gliding motility-associated C-terminal domain-containing protein [Lacinutrix neustonica]WAC02206.1 gliding motility-associated C-terminal domain-containing protein [Lacinutrix neustonica]
MQKITISNKVFIGLCFFVLFFTKQIQAQISIGTPTYGFTQACASNSFNTYNTTFSFTNEGNLGPTNQFSIFLSDANGDFTNSTTPIFTSAAGAVTTSSATLTFSLPTDTAGEGYRIKIKSSDPVASSPGSASFAAYYKIQDSPFSINNLVSTGAYCNGGEYILSIDNPGTGENDSPLNYPSLTFKWFRETGPTTSVPVGGNGPTLSVTQPGTYFVETDYGTCTSNSFSNRVTVSEAVSGEATATISSSLGNPYCPDQGLTTLSTIAGNSYQWFVDGVPIPDAINQSYQTDQSGTFSVIVDLGNCQASGSIDLVSQGFTSSIDVLEENEIDIESGETLVATVTTTATNPEFIWYFNDAIISGATTNSYEATELGNYRVEITQTTGCVVTNEFVFSVNVPFNPFPEVANIPNLISPNGDGINDKWVIPQDYVSGTDSEITIMNNHGKVVFNTKDYQNDWPQEEINLTSINKVYYYIITTPDKEPEKGSISIVK